MQTKNTTLSVDTRGGTAKFHIEAVEPQDAVLCLNTDMEVDIIPLQGVSMSTGPTPQWSKATNPVYSISTNSSMPLYFKIPLLDGFEYYEIRKECTEGDADLFVGGLFEQPSESYHTYYDINPRKGTIVITRGELDLGIASFNIGVRPFQSTCNFTITISALASAPLNDAQIDVERTTDEVDPGKTKCNNCKQYVPSSSFSMHTAFCERNNTLCSLCQQVFKKTEFAMHYHCSQCSFNSDTSDKPKHEYWHQTITCSCGEKYTLEQISLHKCTCPRRLIICRYCHLVMECGDSSRTAEDLYAIERLGTHESECGARTIQCVKCSKQVQLKQMGMHVKMHGYERQNQKLFGVCANVNCSLPASDPANEMKLCAVILADSDLFCAVLEFER
jgi:hypothetical protein